MEKGTPHRDASVQCLNIQRFILKLVSLYDTHGSFNFLLCHLGERIHGSLREQRIDNISADFVLMRILQAQERSRRSHCAVEEFRFDIRSLRPMDSVVWFFNNDVQ